MEVKQEVPNLIMDEDVKNSLVLSISENTIYHLSCAFYYLFKNDIVFLSKKHDIWLCKFNNANRWKIINSDTIITLFNDHISEQLSKLAIYYESSSTNANCPYMQAVNTISGIKDNISYYSETSIEELNEYFSIPDTAGFFSNYIQNDNIIEITGQLFDKYLI
tara:strand:- start:524 stop:1012 length:489 start_codon:yes stop_codon:yes gene_type:complete